MSYYRMHRGWMDNPVLDAAEPYTKREAWEWLIANAVWKERQYAVGTSVITLKPGQLATSLRHLADAWKWTKDRARRFLQTLENANMIRVESATEVRQSQTVVTICNYSIYQGPCDSDVRESATATRQQRDTDETAARQKEEGKEVYINNPPIIPPQNEQARRDGLVDEVDQVRMAVWRQAGLNEDAISTKLVSTSQEGVRQARGWLEKFSLAEALAIITEAYDGAESRGDAIRRPWVYLDRVFTTKAEEKANPEPPASPKADPWEGRRNLLEMGIWLDNYGARPGNVACDAPKWAQELFLANKHKREGRAA